MCFVIASLNSLIENFTIIGVVVIVVNNCSSLTGNRIHVSESVELSLRPEKGTSKFTLLRRQNFSLRVRLILSFLL